MSDEPEEIENEAEAKLENGKRIDSETWTEIERLYEHGEAKGTDLTARYGISSGTLSKRFKSRKITFGSKSPAVAAASAAAAAALAGPPKRTWNEMRETRIEETKRRTYEIHSAIGTMMTNMLREFAGGTATPQDKLNSIKALGLMAKANEITRIGRYVLLDINPDVVEEDLPGILIEDITQDEIDALQRDEDENLIQDEGVEREEDADGDL